MGRGVAGGPRGPHTLAARTAVDAERPAGLRPGKGGHPPDRASGSGAELAVVYHLQGPGVRQGRAAEPPPVHKPGGRIRFIDLTGVPGGGHRGEALREGVGDAPTRPAAGGGDAEGLQGALPHPPARRALPEAGVALRRTSGRPGDTPDKGRAHLHTLGELADGLSEYHDPLWKGCEVPRALCDRDAIAARGRGPAAEAGEEPRPNAAPVCGRDEPPRSAASSAAPREPCGGPPVHPEGRRPLPGSERRIRGGPHADHRPHASGHAQAVPGLWPPANEGGRCRAGKRRASPPRIGQLGWEAPTAKSLGVSDAELYVETRRMQGLPPVATLPDARQWPLHLKHTTPLDLAAVREMPTAHSRTKRFLEQAIQYMNPRRFVGLRTSRTVKTASLPLADVLRAVEMGKFECCDWQPRHPASRRPLPEGVRGVNTFSVPEMKGRRRLITEPHLNALVSKQELPKVEHPTRQWRRQELRYARYMFQLDFVAFYDAIPLPEEMRNKFVFRARDHVLYRCCTLPAGARWSVAVGQAVTWTIVDIDTPVTVFTMIDNMLIGARGAGACVSIRGAAHPSPHPDGEPPHLPGSRDRGGHVGRGAAILGTGRQHVPGRGLPLERERAGGTQRAQDGGQVETGAPSDALLMPVFRVPGVAGHVRHAHDAPEPGGGVPLGAGVPSHVSARGPRPGLGRRGALCGVERPRMPPIDRRTPGRERVVDDRGQDRGQLRGWHVRRHLLHGRVGRRVGSGGAVRERHHRRSAAEVGHGLAPERSRRRRPATHAGAGPAAERRILHRQALGARGATGRDAVPAVPDGARAGREKGPDHAHGGGHGPLCDCAGAAEAQRLRRHRQRVLPEPPVRVHDGPLLYRARAGGVLLHRRPGEPRG
ncbi:hypothetical protein LSCM1_06343 [Leishmania martiniquensis]|uniref:Reverse transcriptase domain-containing protein n=1 Tax=Leishmania martiniquensis TaxID=1580590 RepID=A0A836GWX3_9TRYP|nr:hypothetical protein LSCM1_06343 [Leishmania martiniquensis]